MASETHSHLVNPVSPFSQVEKLRFKKIKQFKVIQGVGAELGFKSRFVQLPNHALSTLP